MKLSNKELLSAILIILFFIGFFFAVINMKRAQPKVQEIKSSMSQPANS